MLLEEWNLKDAVAVAVAKRDGRKEEKIKIAETMKAEGMDVDTISRLTGLTVDDVLRL
jgi:predicted transposase/invertase (TIGR01784 family)